MRLDIDELRVEKPSRRFKFTDDEFMRLYQAKLRDFQIARSLGVSLNAVYLRRKKLGLPKNEKTYKHERKLLEENGLYRDNLEHWEMWETSVYYYPKTGHAFIRVPLDVVRHLGIKNREQMRIAIKRVEK